MTYQRHVDGLRAIAVLVVILFHAGISGFSGGYVGVDVFFVISGYLITLKILGDLEKQRFSLLDFYDKRARRILPALIVVIFCTLPFALYVLIPSEQKDFSQSLMAVVLFSSNILFWTESDYFAGDAEEKPLLHTWSLAVEEQYYLFFPLLLMFLWAGGNRRKTAVPLISLLAICSFFACQWASRHWPTANFYLAPFRVWELLVGSLAAFAAGRWPTGRNGFLTGSLAAAGLLMVLLPVYYYRDSTPFPSVYALAPVLGSALLIRYGGQAGAVTTLLHTRLMVGVGLISYSAYLWHQPMFALADLAVGGHVPATATAVMLVAVFLLAYLSWRFVEQPCRNKKQFPGNRPRVLFSGMAVAMAAIFAIGLMGHVKDGYRDSLAPATQQLLVDIEAQHQLRLDEVYSTVCHYNDRLVQSTIDGFLTSQPCQRTDDMKVALFGDSHSADRAFALGMAGLKTYNHSGAACPLAPSLMSPKCRRIADRFVAELAERPIETLVISNRFEAIDLEPAHLAEAINYWQDKAAHVIWMDPAPEVADYKRAAIRYGQRGKPPQWDQAVLDSYHQAISGQQWGNVVRLSTEELYCASFEGCKPAFEPQLVLTDGHHLTISAAAAFGAQLASALQAIGR